jgi:farnesyl diphosphate synthase
MHLPQQLAQFAALTEHRLTALLDAAEMSGTPGRLIAAMRHACLGGGKRFRPFLLIESASLFGLAPHAAVDAACALEFIHCYSLVHDDLPSMDNDLLRRGQPTVWAAFDEWTAILAGDALQTLAFETLSAAPCHPDGAVRSALVACLAKASGASGMVGGQVLDLEAERLEPEDKATIAHITLLQAMKTGRLIEAACEMGAILGGASDAERRALIAYGNALGFAFQISDDLLDAEGGTEEVGKATGKDAAAGKATLVGLLGNGQARKVLDKTVAEAISHLAPFGERADALADAARFMGRRKS